MTTFNISYDLSKPGRDYQALYKAIIKASDGTYYHCLDSTWIINTKLSAIQVAKVLWAVMDANDKLLVTEVGPDVAWAGLPAEDQEWFSGALAAA